MSFLGFCYLVCVCVCVCVCVSVCVCVGGCVSWNQSLEDTEGWLYKELVEVKECKSSLSSSTTAVSEPLWENACLFNTQSFLGMSRVQTLPFHAEGSPQRRSLTNGSLYVTKEPHENQPYLCPQRLRNP